MSAGEITQGRRINYFDNPEDGHLYLGPGDYGRETNGTWVIRPPRGDAGDIGDSTGHQVIEHEDGTISVSPSIDSPGAWHGFLEHGVWREV